MKFRLYYKILPGEAWIVQTLIGGDALRSRVLELRPAAHSYVVCSDFAPRGPNPPADAEVVICRPE